MVGAKSCRACGILSSRNWEPVKNFKERDVVKFDFLLMELGLEGAKVRGTATR